MCRAASGRFGTDCFTAGSTSQKKGGSSCPLQHLSCCSVEQVHQEEGWEEGVSGGGAGRGKMGQGRAAMGQAWVDWAQEGRRLMKGKGNLKSPFLSEASHFTHSPPAGYSVCFFGMIA